MVFGLVEKGGKSPIVYEDRVCLFLNADAAVAFKKARLSLTSTIVMPFSVTARIIED